MKRNVHFTISDENWWWLQNKFQNRQASPFIDDLLSGVRKSEDEEQPEEAELLQRMDEIKQQLKELNKEHGMIQSKLSRLYFERDKATKDDLKQKMEVVDALKANSDAIGDLV